jgi:hypothetical protein
MSREPHDLPAVLFRENLTPPAEVRLYAAYKSTAPAHTDENCYLIVECKKKTRKDGRGQLEDYLHFSKACLGVWYNGKETLYLRKYPAKI